MYSRIVTETATAMPATTARTSRRTTRSIPIATARSRSRSFARACGDCSPTALAVVVAGLEYFGPSRTLVGIEEQASDLGYTLLLDLLHLPQNDSKDVEDVLDVLTSHRVDGIIWAVHEIDANREWIVPDRLRQLPPIVFLTMGERPGLSVLATDNRRGAALAIEHLIDQGRRTIGIVTGLSTL